MKGSAEHALDGLQFLYGVTGASFSSPLPCSRLLLKKPQMHLYNRTKRDEITFFTHLDFRYLEST